MSKIINTAVEIGTFGLVDDVTGVEASEKAALQAAQTQADAGKDAIELLQKSKTEALGYIDPSQSQNFLQSGADAAQGYFNPYAQIGQQGIDNASILTDPQAQYDFLKSNPLFQASLDNANQQTNQMAAARGRLSSGDTLTSLSNNTLLAASPLLAQQQQNVSNLLGFGAGIAGNQASIASSLSGNQANINQAAQLAQANAALGTGTQIGGLTTDIGAALAGGQVGAANANTQFNNSLLQLGGSFLGGAS